MPSSSVLSLQMSKVVFLYRHERNTADSLTNVQLRHQTGIKTTQLLPLVTQTSTYSHTTSPLTRNDFEIGFVLVFSFLLFHLSHLFHDFMPGDRKQVQIIELFYPISFPNWPTQFQRMKINKRFLLLAPEVKISIHLLSPSFISFLYTFFFFLFFFL